MDLIMKTNQSAATLWFRKGTPYDGRKTPKIIYKANVIMMMFLDNSDVSQPERFVRFLLPFLQIKFFIWKFPRHVVRIPRYVQGRTR